MKFGLYLKDKEFMMLIDFMKKNKIKSKSEAVRKCIEIATSIKDEKDLFYDMNNKLNRLLYRESLTKKLIEQLFANYNFRDNKDVKRDECLMKFYQENNSYSDKLME